MANKATKKKPETKEEVVHYKTYRAEVKGTGDEAGLVYLDIPMNTSSVDRDGEIVEPTGAQHSLPAFNKRPILVSSHNYGDLRKQIGEFVGLKITEDGLKPEGVKYYVGAGNEEADWAYFLATKGVAAFSIGFIPTKWEPMDEDDGFFSPRHYTEWELLEISQVVVPSNRDAQQSLRSKAAEDPVMSKLWEETRAALPVGMVLELDKGEELDVTKPYPNEHACRLRDPDDFTDGSFKRYTREHEGKKYSVIAGKLEGEDDMTEQAFRYDKEVWTAAQARSHCSDHDGSFEAASGNEGQAPPPAKLYSQEEIQDDIEYLAANIMLYGMNEKTHSLALELAEVIVRRTTGADMPDDIIAKVGAVLNAKNKGLLETARDNIDKVLASAGKEDDEKGVEEPEPPEPEKPYTAEDLAEVVRMARAMAAGKRIH